jgi:hypothetical protein
MNRDESLSFSDSIHIAQLLQKIRILKLDMKRLIEHNRDSKVTSNLIMASGLLDGVLEALAKCISE